MTEKQDSDKTSIDIVNERLARGEISKEEHREIIDTIKSARTSNDELFLNKTSSEIDDQPVQHDGALSRKGIAMTAFGIGIVVMLFLNYSGDGESTTRTSIVKQQNWIYKEETTSSGLKRYLFGLPVEASGNYGDAYLRMGCYSSDMGITLMWGSPLKNAFPNSTQDGVIVSTQFGQSQVKQMGWAPSPDFFQTYPPTGFNAAGGLIDSLIFNALGIEHKNQFSWTPRQFSRELFQHSEYGDNRAQLVLGARAVNGQNVILKFDLKDYSDLAKRHFAPHCR